MRSIRINTFFDSLKRQLRITEVGNKTFKIQFKKLTRPIHYSGAGRNGKLRVISFEEATKEILKNPEIAKEYYKDEITTDLLDVEREFYEFGEPFYFDWTGDARTIWKWIENKLTEQNKKLKDMENLADELKIRIEKINKLSDIQSEKFDKYMTNKYSINN